MKNTSVLFVCLGNICRSPLAEGAFRHLAGESGVNVTVDSAGTAGYHIDEPPDPRSVAEAARHGIDISHLRGRRLVTEDFHRFDWIIGMDRANLRAIEALRPLKSAANIALLLDLVPGREGSEVADPWYGDAASFRQTWEEVWQGAQALMRQIQRS